MAQTLLLVDTDCGIDDAQAIMMALAAPRVRILGITCCFGNTSVENVCRNTLEVLKVCNKLEIPVFCGAASSLIGGPSLSCDHFGKDGLGDVLFNGNEWTEQLQAEPAVSAMIRLASEYQGQVSVVAIGPLTNLALAVRMDPTFPQKLKNLYIMGGNMQGQGNRSACGEFNFVMDPEAAHVVLNEFSCPTYIATWEFTCQNKLPWEFFDKWVNQGTEKAEFMKKITSSCKAYFREVTSRKDLLFGNGFVPYDSFAMAAAINNSAIVEMSECAASVELSGHLTRGMMAVDPMNELNTTRKIFVMKKCNMNVIKELLWMALN
ncbi:uncharacterized protein si:ch211-201h21.5 [Erpetoichthys calabaricus]|uniref:uncharacterized protein si:ch211-201h21.5 n=1 Tax=Erpetoichthys calabaricus TaxID=27687 RepID=UPI002234DA9C|nr:uncharacterized protein si:ch211-201h21.5 [Erpetoichthys calabaricus]